MAGIAIEESKPCAGKFHLQRSSEALNWHSEALTDIARSAFHKAQCPLQYTKLSNKGQHISLPYHSELLFLNY